MNLYQYKIEHYGKCFKNEPTDYNEKLYTYIEADSIDVNTPATWTLSVRSAARRSQEDIEKFILLEIDRKSIPSPVLPKMFQTYMRVHTQHPFNKKYMKFWVNFNWLEPLQSKSYEEVQKEAVLKKLQEKWNKG